MRDATLFPLGRQVALLSNAVGALVHIAIRSTTSLSRARTTSLTLVSGEFFALLCRVGPYLHFAIRLSDSESPWLCTLKETDDLRKDIPCKACIEVFDRPAGQRLG
jgi:hypothetical protein